MLEQTHGESSVDHIGQHFLLGTGDPHPHQSRLCLKVCTLWRNGTHCRHWEGLSMGRIHTEEVSENCLPWEGSHVAAGEGLLSLSRGKDDV